MRASVFKVGPYGSLPDAVGKVRRKEVTRIKLHQNSAMGQRRKLMAMGHDSSPFCKKDHFKEMDCCVLSFEGRSKSNQM